MQTALKLAAAGSLAAAFLFTIHTAEGQSTASPAANAPHQDKAIAQQACPHSGFTAAMKRQQQPNAGIETAEPTDDCEFHQWAWENFAWATAPDQNGRPRFLSLTTPNDLVSGSNHAQAGELVLSTRVHKSDGKREGAGAIVEADGNMLVGPNGYPVYASVHMNDSYAKTAKENLIANGNYLRNLGTDPYFEVGAAVFKATWMRIDSVKDAPAGAFVTDAKVPVLTFDPKNPGMVVVKTDATTGKPVTVSAKVALVGLHVVGFSKGHPEFLWATFEHHLNTPRLFDNDFANQCPQQQGCAAYSPEPFTFYQAGTPYSNVNIATDTTPPAAPVLTFHEKTQTFSPVSNALQENMTGGETNSPNGPQNIFNLNSAAHHFLRGESAKNEFANYDLIGTVWFQPNVYTNENRSAALQMNQAQAVGSVNLANSTAETFVQSPTDQTSPANLGNCFACHNAQSYVEPASGPLQSLPRRRVAISHVLAVHSPYEVTNTIPAASPAP
ncbi:MAG TPA: hypothetical protein VF472_04085 [Burkholderiaceae bacterium]